MLTSGIVVCLGICIWFTRVRWRTRLWLISHPLLVDVGVFAFLTFIHWGTFSGVMAATIGALMTSVLMSGARKLWGFYQGRDYVRGMIDVSTKLKGV